MQGYRGKLLVDFAALALNNDGIEHVTLPSYDKLLTLNTNIFGGGWMLRLIQLAHLNESFRTASKM